MKTKLSLISILLIGVSSLYASSGASLYKACAGCHGINGEKKALGKSGIIKGWKASKVEEALLGYKNRTYGKAMKGLMKGQVSRLDKDKIQAISKYIATFK